MQIAAYGRMLLRVSIRAWFILLLVLCGLVSLRGLLVTQDAPRSADAIVVIGGDHKPERMRRTAQLYQDGYARQVIISSGTVVLEGGRWLVESEVMREQALKLGIPGEAILLEDESTTTFENALRVKTLCEQHQIGSILLVTSTYQSGRAGRMFRDVMGRTMAVTVQPALRMDGCAGCGLSWQEDTPVVLSEYWKWGIYLTMGR